MLRLIRGNCHRRATYRPQHKRTLDGGDCGPFARDDRVAEPPSIITGDRTVMRRLPVRQIEQNLIHIAPAPSFGRIVAFDDWMSGGVEMFGGMLIGRIVAA